MRIHISIIILGLAFCSCEKNECIDDDISNSLIHGDGPSSFQRIVGANCSSNSLLSVIQSGDSGYVVCGTTTTNVVDGFDILVLKTDNRGETTWHNSYSYIEYDCGIKTVKTKDNGFLILASSQPCFGWGGEFSCQMDLILLKFSSNALLEWEKIFKLNTYSSLLDIYQSPDDGFLVFYNQVITNNDRSSYSQSSYIKTDENGQKILEDKAPLRFIWDVAKTQDKGYIICGFDEDNDSISIIKLNPQGESVWTKTIDGFSQYTVSSITEISDGYAICGTHNIEAYVEVAFIMILDSEGNEIWKDDYLDDYDLQIDHNDSENGVQRSFQNSLVTRDENLVVIGQNSDSDGGINCTAYLLKISPTTGAVIWKKSYDLGNQTLLNDIQNTSDNGFILAGETITFSYGTSGNSEGYLVKTDEYGN